MSGAIPRGILYGDAGFKLGFPTVQANGSLTFIADMVGGAIYLDSSAITSNFATSLGVNTPLDIAPSGNSALRNVSAVNSPHIGLQATYAGNYRCNWQLSTIADGAAYGPAAGDVLQVFPIVNGSVATAANVVTQSFTMSSSIQSPTVAGNCDVLALHAGDYVSLGVCMRGAGTLPELGIQSYALELDYVPPLP
jgi:hypothetical protein